VNIDPVPAIDKTEIDLRTFEHEPVLAQAIRRVGAVNRCGNSGTGITLRRMSHMRKRKSIASSEGSSSIHS